MSLIRINHCPSRRELNVFGLIWLFFFGVIGGIILHKTGSKPTAVGIWTLAVVIPSIGFLLPGWMRFVYLGMAYAAFPIGFVLSHIIMAMVYYGILTPIGLLMRLVGYDPMHRRFDRKAESYWQERSHDSSDVKRYFRQY